MADSGGEKKHAPTMRRRQRAREEGRVARSGDLNSAVLLIAALSALWMLGGHAAEHLTAAVTEGLSQTQIGTFTTDDATYTLLRGGGRLAIAVVPMLVAMMVVGVLVNISQTGFLLLPAKLAPSLQNVSPVTGFQRIFSLSSIARFGFGVLKVAVVLVVAYAAINHYGDQILNLAGMEIPLVARTLFECLLGTCLWIASALFVLSIIDYGFQRWKHERDLMMTDEELREELCETDGDPAIAQRRKEIQQSRPSRTSHSNPNGPGQGGAGQGGAGQGGAGQGGAGQGGAEQGGAEQGTHPAAAADLIITAPSGVAVALRYNPMTMAAPTVVAKGSGDEAEKIQSIAARARIRQSSQPLLAQHQFRSVAVGSQIPANQYVSVANLMRAS